MTLYTVLSNDRGHIYIVMVLQSCTDSLHILPSSSSEPFPTSDSTHDVGNTDFDEDLVLIEESLIDTKKEDICIKEEEIIKDIMAETDGVSCVRV